MYQYGISIHYTVLQKNHSVPLTHDVKQWPFEDVQRVGRLDSPLSPSAAPSLFNHKLIVISRLNKIPNLNNWNHVILLYLTRFSIYFHQIRGLIQIFVWISSIMMYFDWNPTLIYWLINFSEHSVKSRFDLMIFSEHSCFSVHYLRKFLLYERHL